MYDLLIRGATVVDGLGRDPRRADGPGQVLDRFLPTGPTEMRSAADVTPSRLEGSGAQRAI
jgi:hypothetical protein